MNGSSLPPVRRKTRVLPEPPPPQPQTDPPGLLDAPSRVVLTVAAIVALFAFTGGFVLGLLFASLDVSGYGGGGDRGRLAIGVRGVGCKPLRAQATRIYCFRTVRLGALSDALPCSV